MTVVPSLLRLCRQRCQWLAEIFIPVMQQIDMEKKPERGEVLHFACHGPNIHPYLLWALLLLSLLLLHTFSLYLAMSSGEQPVPLIIGGSSSVTAQILSRLLGPLSVPLVSSTEIRMYIYGAFIFNVSTDYGVQIEIHVCFHFFLSLHLIESK